MRTTRKTIVWKLENFSTLCEIRWKTWERIFRNNVSSSVFKSTRLFHVFVAKFRIFPISRARILASQRRVLIKKLQSPTESTSLQARRAWIERISSWEARDARGSFLGGEETDDYWRTRNSRCSTKNLPSSHVVNMLRSFGKWTETKESLLKQISSSFLLTLCLLHVQLFKCAY